MRISERSWEDFQTATRYGKLYQITRIHKTKLVCSRIRTLHGKFLLTQEKITIEKNPESNLNPEIGDYTFVDNGDDPAWSLWKLQEKPK